MLARSKRYIKEAILSVRYQLNQRSVCIRLPGSVLSGRWELCVPRSPPLGTAHLWPLPLALQQWVHSMMGRNCCSYNSMTQKAGFQLTEKGLPDTFWHRRHLTWDFNMANERKRQHKHQEFKRLTLFLSALSEFKTPNPTAAHSFTVWSKVTAVSLWRTVPVSAESTCFPLVCQPLKYAMLCASLIWASLIWAVYIYWHSP